MTSDNLHLREIERLASALVREQSQVSRLRIMLSDARRTMTAVREEAIANDMSDEAFRAWAMESLGNALACRHPTITRIAA